MQPEPYRNEVLGTAPRIAVEAAVAQGWHEWLRPGDRFIGLSDFGVSAPGPKVFEHFGLTAPKIAEAARAAAKKG
jgi:transketolase